MIFNDSIFTSSDALEFRRKLLSDGDGKIRLAAVARTKCFEGKQINGGVLVAVEEPPANRPIRYVENYGRSPDELGGASVAAASGKVDVGRSELWVGASVDYFRLPHRPFFRPSPPAVALLDRFEACAAWDEFGRISADGADWETLSETRALERWKDDQRSIGFFRRLRAPKFVLLGLVVEGGQGLATADDRRFLAAIDGTPESDQAREMRDRLEAAVLERPQPAAQYRSSRAEGRGVEDALLAVSQHFKTTELGWPRGGLIRIASPANVARRVLTPQEVSLGIPSGPSFVPFEKTDDADEGGGAAAWRRDNPIVIDWSAPSVALLRSRAQQGSSYRKPYLRNEDLWGKGGVTWNRVARYFRARLVPEGAIFGDMAPTIRPMTDWLSTSALLALLNSSPLDFTLRTFLGSLMHIELGDIRHLPIPVLSDNDASRLDELGRRAVAAKSRLDHGEQGEPLPDIEVEVDGVVRDLYGIRRDAELWVVR